MRQMCHRFQQILNEYPYLMLVPIPGALIASMVYIRLFVR